MCCDMGSFCLAGARGGFGNCRPTDARVPALSAVTVAIPLARKIEQKTAPGRRDPDGFRHCEMATLFHDDPGSGLPFPRIGGPLPMPVQPRASGAGVRRHALDLRRRRRRLDDDRGRRVRRVPAEWRHAKAPAAAFDAGGECSHSRTHDPESNQTFHTTPRYASRSASPKNKYSSVAIARNGPNGRRAFANPP